jgi:hypothetical protein
MKKLETILSDVSLSGFLRKHYHPLIREILIYSYHIYAIKLVNVNNDLHNEILANCLNIKKLKDLGKATKMLEYEFNRKYGLIYTNILLITSSIKYKDNQLREKIEKLCQGDAIPFENGLSEIPFLKLPFYIIIKRKI